MSFAESESRSSSNYNSRSGGGSGGGGGGNGYEDENPYDGEREDSDQESHGHHSGGGGGGGGGASKRYYDRDQENNNSTSGRSSATRTNSGIDKSVTPTVAAKPAATVVQPKAKKIDLGAAASFGKSSNLDINSPTHTAGPVTTVQGGDLIDDFSDDLFNAPAASNSAAVDNSQEFGDFSSAFGPATTTTTSVNNSNNNEDDFADFSAFESSPSTGLGGVVAAPAMPAFSNIPSASPLPPTQQPLSDNLLFMGMSGVNTMMASPMGGASSSHSPAMGGQDLLADFGDLNMNQPTMGASAASGE